MAGRSARTAVSGLAALGLAAAEAAGVFGAASASASAASANAVSANVVSANTVSSVTCTYTVTAWHGGFTANVQIANNGPTAINGWTVRWTFAVPTTVVSGWSATITDTDGHDVTATNVFYNGTIGSGLSMSFGWSAEAVSTDEPTDLTVNGVPC